jgi:4,5-dihydroxyphthalate decarboxylase
MRLPVTMAISDYDHVRDLTSGKVSVGGIDLLALDLTVEEIFHRFSTYREWDVSELSFAKYVALRSRGDDSVTAIPVFPSRVCRHSAIYVRRDHGLDGPAALRGRRVGVPEWAQTAGVYARGLLAEDYGLGIEEVHWVQAGVNQAGRVEHASLRPVAGLTIERVGDRALVDMLLAGDLDAVISAHPPHGFGDGSEDIVRLVSDTRRVEEDYVRRTGIFPIMHVIAIKSELLDGRRWVVMNLYKAFEEAKQRSIERAMDWTASRFPLPWLPEYLVASRAAFAGQDPFPYGIEPNRTTLEAFLRWSYDQGVADRKLTPEELFAPEASSVFRV